jgi:LAO/AO transport system kinase
MSRSNLSLEELKKGILAGNASFIGRAITLVESRKASDRSLAQALITQLLPYSGKSLRIGITGSPGVGKSTFIDSFGAFLIQKEKKIAVLAIDPSSKISGGSILGDKTRMQNLVGNPAAFVRPSPAGVELGGVARATYESILICEAAGFDIILIETVGVGQSETTVKDLTDLLLFITITGAGDELQGIKRGIMEMVDLVLINKCDQVEKGVLNTLIGNLTIALHLFPEKKSGLAVEVKTCSAVAGLGLADIYTKIDTMAHQMKQSGFLISNRNLQKLGQLKRSFEQLLIQDYYENEELGVKMNGYNEAILQDKISPLEAAQQLFSFFKEKNKAQ